MFIGGVNLSQRKVLINLLCFVLIFLLIGCTSKDVTSVSEISRLEDKISSLENTLEIQQGKLEEQEIQLKELTSELGRIEMLERKVSFQE